MSGVEVVPSQATFDESRITWTEAKSAKGATYHIGRLEDHDGPAASEAKGVTPGLSGAGNCCPVDWPVGADEWKDTTQDVKDKVHITRYNLHRNLGYITIYEYVLFITNTRPLYYEFKDGSEDVYGLWCHGNGDHYLKYNSGKPNINLVCTNE